MTRIIDGKAMAAQIRAEMKEEVALLAQRGIVPGLAVVLVGDDPASHVYVRNKKKACEEVGIRSFSHELPANTTEGALLELIDELNADPAVDGVLVQMPLPKGIDARKVLDRILPDKDADGFHPCNVGLMALGTPRARPCTPWGVMEMLRREGIDPAGKIAVVVGRSDIVGKPAALMLLLAHATPIICHSRTPNLEELVGMGDIVVAATGKPRMIRGSWLKPGAVVIDVGINRLPDGTLCGDVHYEEALARGVAAITPVPGGVGPMTIAMLLKNTLAAAGRK
ncbi:MAG: bifunctional methylenetetrahydrofolate dehydrogenase/methenyltetrahydrofolate cyclohydrolase FolD [Magnetococcales bacterium]|nr:bifunctional methylenetetrahydrofolate dehydrogenase/methenyltetrahydrofolate cyclohydrolase FolD [Magnetococcales bacterium]